MKRILFYISLFCILLSGKSVYAHTLKSCNNSSNYFFKEEAQLKVLTTHNDNILMIEENDSFEEEIHRNSSNDYHQKKLFKKNSTHNKNIITFNYKNNLGLRQLLYSIKYLFTFHSITSPIYLTFRTLRI